MKLLLSVLLVTSITFTVQAQRFTEADLFQLNQLGLATTQLNIADERIALSLNEILKRNHRHQNSKRAGTVISLLGAGMLVVAATQVYSGNYDQLNKGLVLGFAGAGVCIISIPFHVGAYGARRKRDQLINKLQ